MLPKSLLLVLAALIQTVHPSALVETTVSVLLQNFPTYGTTLISQAAVSPSGEQLQWDLINKILTRLKGSIVVRFNTEYDNPLRRPWIRILQLVDSYESFRKLYGNLCVEKYDFSGRYLIVYSGSEEDDIERKIFEDLWKLQIVNVVVVKGRVGGGVRLWSYVPYTEHSCGQVNLVELKLAETLYPDKTGTFYGCMFKVASFESRPFTIMDRSETDLKVSGFEGDLLDTLKAKLNFKAKIFEPENGELWGYALKQNSTGIMRMIQEEEVDFGISCLGISVARNEILKPGLVHYTTALVLAVPKGRPYTPLEKLFQPFLLNVWICIIVTTLGALVIISFIELRSVKVRDFVYGNRIRTPYLNLVQVFFGIGMPLLPSRNFARTLLFFWIYFSFVIRTLYQGALFHYLQQDANLPPSRTLAEIDKTEAFYYVVQSAERYYESFPHRYHKVRHLPEEKNNIVNRLKWTMDHPEFRDVTMGALDHMAYHNFLYRRKGGFINVCPEFISTYTVAIYYPKKSMLTQQFDEQIMRIQASGLMSYWINRYGDYDFFGKPRSGGSEPRQLSWEHLSVVYELCAVCLGISWIVFGLEKASRDIGWLKRGLDRFH